MPAPLRDLRNVAIIAHVDHGKTTLVDALFRTAHSFRANQRVDICAMDSDPIERERGITILAKNTGVLWRGTKINIVDTPGHADFGGEVERVLSMADGALLVVDAFEGPMPQTRFVLRKAFAAGLRPIVVLNKMDRPEARPSEVLNEVFDLFVDLDAPEESLDFPVLYASGRDGWASTSPTEKGEDVTALLDTILRVVPAPTDDPGKPLQFQAATLDYDEYLGRVAIGRVRAGKLRANGRVALVHPDGRVGLATDLKGLFRFEALSRIPAEEVSAGDIAAVAGIPEVSIGDTLADPEHPVPLPGIAVDEPTISMYFFVNDSPFAGRDGRYVTSRQIKDRLDRAALGDAALRLERTSSPDEFKVSGRGVMHLGILIERMRREGYEVGIGKPQVIVKLQDGKRVEPIELAVVDCPEPVAGRVIEFLGRRRGELHVMDRKGSFARLEFLVPSRGLIGARTAILTLTGGEGTLHHVFHSWGADRGAIAGRTNGAIVATEMGKATGYALEEHADRGAFFVGPGDEVYQGQMIGEHCKEQDLLVNVAKSKKLTNVRADSKDTTIRLAPPHRMGLEEALEYIEEDELVEATPKAIRLRKALLNAKSRKRAATAVGQSRGGSS
ncbi:MAG TPA: translational GTPase TypA [Planctomycetota bacterium]|nr:translational GTPase TypA [Planctomycetota bacterium]